MGGAVYTRSVRIASAVLTSFAFAMGAGVGDARLVRVIDDPNGDSGGRFGHAVAAVGTDIAVGAPGATVFDQAGAGRVLIFTSDGRLRRTLEAVHPGPDAGFGSAIAVSEGLLYVGSPGDRPVGPGGVGAVYVFRTDTGALVRVLRAPDPGQGSALVGGTPVAGGVRQSTAAAPAVAGFGRALAVASGLVAVGAPDSIVDGLDGAGAVCIFGVEGRLRRIVRDFPPQAGARSGAAVALLGDLLVVGEPGAGTADARAGLVQLLDAATGDPVRTLRAVIPGEDAAFGSVVGAISDALLVAAPGDRGGAGAVFLFDRETGALREAVDPPTSTPGLHFGSAVVAVGGNLAIGADGNGEQSGTAYLADPVTFVFRATFVPTRQNPAGRFGFALAAVGTAIAIGEPSADEGSTSGRVYLFDDAPGPSGTASDGLSRGGGRTGPTVPACVAAATSPSIDCRLGTLLDAVRATHLRPLVRPLHRARREVRRAGKVDGQRRARRLRGAMRGLAGFTRGVERPGRVAAPADLREWLLLSAEALHADLQTLLAPAGP